MTQKTKTETLRRLFNVGRLAATPQVIDNLHKIDEQEGHKPGHAMLRLLIRHVTGDWGDLTAFDKRENTIAVKAGNLRILSKYDTTEGAVYIITEWDRSYTTVMMASEY